MKRNLLFLFFFSILQMKIWSTDFILSVSNKTVLSRTDEYCGITFCFLENNLVLFDFYRSQILINNEWLPLFEMKHDKDAIELSGKYGVSTSPYIDYYNKHLFIEIKDRNNESNYFCYEFVIQNKELIKYNHSREEFLQVKTTLHDFWQDYPIFLEDNSEVQFFSKVIDLKTYEYQTYFQAAKNGEIIFNFLESIPEYKILTRPCINDKKNKIVILGCDKDAKKGYTDYCTVFIFSIIYDATINDTNVRLRSEPNLNCETLTYLNEDDNIKIYDRSDEIFKINDEDWYWYQVKTNDGTTGWVYGKYLDIEK